MPLVAACNSTSVHVDHDPDHDFSGQRTHAWKEGVGRRVRLRLSAFARALAAVVVTVLDFDRTVVGLIQLDQESLGTRIADLEAELGP